MRTIRRLYFYAVAFASLEVVLWGLIGLLRSTFSPGEPGGGAQLLAQSLALTFVGVPVFGLHWWVVQQDARREMDEHASGIRGFFLYAVLLSTLIPVVQNFIALLNRFLLEAFSLSPYQAIFGASQTWTDNLIAMLMNALVASYFIRTLRLDWKQISPKDAFSDLRRVYRYIWMIYALVMVIAGVQQVLRFVLGVSPTEFGMLFRSYFANGLTLLIAGTPLWYFSWKTVQDSLVELPEKESILRLGILYALALAGVVTVLTSSGLVFDVILRWIFGEAKTWQSFWQSASGPISIAIPLAGVWAYYGYWLNRAMTDVPEGPRRAGMHRLYSYILAALGLGATFIGLSMLLSFVVDTLVGDVLWASYLRPRLAGSLATLLAGFPLWWFTWRPMQAEAIGSGDAGDHARRSLVRKVYLYVALFASVIGGMASAGTMLYTLFNQVLGVHSATFLADFLKALEWLFLFVLLGIYHGMILRRDGRMALQALATKHAAFATLVLDPGDNAFAASIQAAVQKQIPALPVMIYPAGEAIPDETLETCKAIILPTDLALEPPKVLGSWLHKFNGSRLVIPRATPGWVWVGSQRSDVNQAAATLRKLAEGQEVQPRTISSGWMIVFYIIAALFGLEILFLLFGMVMSAFFD